MSKPAQEENEKEMAAAGGAGAVEEKKIPPTKGTRSSCKEEEEEKDGSLMMKKLATTERAAAGSSSEPNKQEDGSSGRKGKEKWHRKPKGKEQATSSSSDSTAKKKAGTGGSSKSGSGGGSGSGGLDVMPPKVKEDVYLSCAIASTGRSPADGYIMSLAMCAITLDKRILGTFSVNMLPLSPKEEALGTPEVLNYWRSNRDELNLVLRDPVPPAVGMARLVDWCKAFGKGATLTLVANPILTVFSFLAHYIVVCCPGLKAPPWGYSGVCARSFCSGVLGVPTKELTKNAQFLQWVEGMTQNLVPANDAVLGAILYANALRASLKLPPIPADWQSVLKGKIPPLVGVTPCAVSAKLGADSVCLPFHKYPSIVDPSFDATVVTTLAKSANQTAHISLEGSEMEWVVTEKVHGANISIVTDGKVFRCGRRTALLKRAEAPAFFSYDFLISKLESKVFKLFDVLRTMPPPTDGPTKDLLRPVPMTSLPPNANDDDDDNRQLELKTVTVFGEIAGGEYSHPLIAPDVQGHKVQSGVQYSPSNFFYAFDMLLRYGPKEEERKEKEPEEGEEERPVALGTLGSSSSCSSEFGTKWMFVPYEQLCRVLDEVGLCRTETLFTGSFADAMNFTPVFPTTLPKTLGLPPLPSGNFAEGVVIRPTKDVWVDCGGSVSEDGRLQLRGEPPLTPLSITTPTTPASPSGGLALYGGLSRVMFKRKHPKFCEMVSHNAPIREAPLAEIAESMLTESRLASVLSKLTMSERQDVSLVAQLLADDALADATQYKGNRKTSSSSSPSTASAPPLVLTHEEKHRLQRAAAVLIQPTIRRQEEEEAQREQEEA